MCIRLCIFALFGIVIARDHIEDRKNLGHNSHLSEIPKEFLLHGKNPEIQFKKYALDIDSLAQKQNLTVRYKVKVDTMKPINRLTKKMKKYRSKTFNVPLKKSSMKISSRELMQRRLADMKEAKTEKIITLSTQKKPIAYSTKAPHNGKYRPIINGVKTNYKKKVMPVKSKVVVMKN